jgi:hypothetical protein
MEPPSSDRLSAHPQYICVLHAQTPFLFSQVFALCRSEDRIRAISIKNGLIRSRAEVLANDSLSAGQFRFWPKSTSETAKVLEAHEL